MSINKYEAGNFSSLAYVSDGGSAPNGWIKLLNSNEVNLGSDGYFGVAYVKVDSNNIATDVAIAHRGTVPTDPDDLIADVQLALNHANNHQKDDALQFLNNVENAYDDFLDANTSISGDAFTSITTNTGHSLGGWLATHSANSMGSDGVAITFDSPASGLLSTNANITHYLNKAPASVINSAGGNRVGTVYRLEPDMTYSKEEPVGFLNHLANIPVAFADAFLHVPVGLKEFVDRVSNNVADPVTTIIASPFIAAKTISAHSLANIIQLLDTAEIDLGSSDVSIEEYYYVGDYSNSGIVGGVLKYIWDIGFNQVAGIPIEDVADTMVDYININPAFDADNPVVRLRVGGNSSEEIQASDTTDQFVISNNGNDTLGAGNTASHTLSGGEGFDIIDYSAMAGSDFVNVDMLSGNTYLNLADGAIPSGEPKDIFVDIEGVIGTQNGDVILGNALSNIILGGGENDTLDGDAGNDILIGGAGDDIIHGGIDFDWLEYEDDVTQGINVSITAQDSINGGFSGTVNEVINTATGGPATTVAGTDTFTGIEGIFATDYGDTVTLDDPVTSGLTLSLELGLGVNTLNLSDQADVYNLFLGTERLHVSTPGDEVRGSIVINAGDGNDLIRGSMGNDTLVGGGDDDTLIGGNGHDVYSFSATDGEDTVRDTIGDDRIFIEEANINMTGLALEDTVHSGWDYVLQFGTETAYLKWEGDPNVVGSRGDLIVDFDATFYYDIVIEDFSNGEFDITLANAADGEIDPGGDNPDDLVNPIFTYPGSTGDDTIQVGNGEVFTRIIIDGNGGDGLTYEDDDGIGGVLEPGGGNNSGLWLGGGGNHIGVAVPIDPYVGSNDNYVEDVAIGAGDPHLLTFDGLFYDFQDTGEFTLTQSTDINPFTVQARMQEWNLGDAVGDKFSVNTAIATELGTNTIGFYIDGSLPYDFEAAALDDNRYNDQHPNMYIDDAPYFMPNYSVIILENYEGYIYRQNDQYTVVNELGDTIKVHVHETHLDVAAFAGVQRTTGTLEGLFGNYDGDITNEYTLDDGTNLGDTISVDTLYDTFGEDWRITQGESLFLYGEGQNTSSFDNPDFIPTLRTVDDFDAATVAAAEAAAIAEGFDPTSAIFDAAVLDFIVMGEVDYNQVWQAAELRTAVAQANITEYGDDLIEGTSASDAIYGTDEQDYILAYDSNDTVYADDGDDIIIGGAGDDILYGQGGADRFVHYQGDGNDHIYGGQYNSQNVVFMYDANGNWLTQDDMQFIVGSRDLQIVNRDSGEIITIDNLYYSAGKTVASVNGIDITGGLTFAGTDSHDNLVGTESNDTIEAGLGNDTIYGDHGDDTYIHREGDGNDHIYSGEYNSSDVIFMYDALGGLLAEEDLQFIISSRDLKIVNRNNDETVTVDNQYYSAGKSIFSVNGIDISGAMSFVGTDAIDVITATEFNDTIEGGLGNDTIYGDDGDDVYIHHYGDGNDHLHSGEYNSNDVVFMYDSLGGMIAEADLLFSVYGYDLRVEDRATGEYVILDNQYYSSGKSFAFINNIAIDGGLNIVATDDAETFYGTEYDDTLVGGGGDDIIYGDDGNDVYLHYRGDGNDHLLSGEYNSLDAVYMYDDNNNLIPEADLQFIVSSNDLIVKDRISGETVTLDNAYYSSGNTFASVNGIDLSGGVNSVGTSAGESIYGTEYADTLEGAGGTDYVYGGDGHDTFIHREGDGNDYLFNNGYNQTDEIFMFDDLDMQIVEADLMFTQSGADMVVTHTENSETLVLDNFFYSQGSTFGSLNGIDLDTVI